MDGPLLVGIVGAGRVGTALAYHLHNKKQKIVGIYDIDPRAIDRCYRLLGILPRKRDLRTVVERARVLFVTTPDHALTEVLGAVRPYLKPHDVVVHTSGRHPSEVFSDLRGAHGLAFHPVQTFPSVETAVASLPRSFFVLEGDKIALRTGHRIAQLLEGEAVTIRTRDRALYHAMCVFVSNFLVVLFDCAEGMAKGIGIGPALTRKLLTPLAAQTLRNVKSFGPVAALSGPVERGETGTVEAHLESLERNQPDLSRLYRELSLRALDLAQRKKTLKKDEAAELERILNEKQ